MDLTLYILSGSVPSGNFTPYKFVHSDPRSETSLRTPSTRQVPEGNLPVNGRRNRDARDSENSNYRREHSHIALSTAIQRELSQQAPTSRSDYFRWDCLGRNRRSKLNASPPAARFPS